MSKSKAREIEKKSMEIISRKVNLEKFDSEESQVVKRIIQTTGDLEIHNDIRFSQSAIKDGIGALKRGVDIFTDVQMVAAGLNKDRLGSLGSAVRCKISDPEVVKQAESLGETRAETAMNYFGDELDKAIVAIGNAPTALFKLLYLKEKHQIAPALVVGVPVGFVDAKESKDRLIRSDLSFITVTGYKGGSPVAASIINALLRML